jgi:hypothetical protein
LATAIGKFFIDFDTALVPMPSAPANGITRPATSTPISADNATSTPNCEVTDPYDGPDVGRWLGMRMILGPNAPTTRTSHSGSPFEPFRFGTNGSGSETVQNP